MIVTHAARMLRVVLGSLVLAATPAAALAENATPARLLFGAIEAPAPGEARAIGAHAAGCLAGGVALADQNETWVAMRPSRNRAYGHPEFIEYVKRLANAAREIGWGRLLVGDLTQPRGGPMRSGHRSHQSGLDGDFWLRPGPNEDLTWRQREDWSSHRVVAPDRRSLNAFWTPAHGRLLRAAAQDDAVARIFVNPVIKRELCATAPDGPRDWLGKVRPWWGHDAHFHVRLHCPEDEPLCVDQAPPPEGDGCEAVEWWFTEEAEKPSAPTERKELTLSDLPAECGPLVDAQ